MCVCMCTHIICVYECSVCMQERASDPTIDSSEPLCDCRELNSVPLDEEPVLLTTEPLAPGVLKDAFQNALDLECSFLISFADGSQVVVRIIYKL